MSMNNAGLILDYFADVPHVADYFGIWAVYDQPFRQIVEQFNQFNQVADLRSHITNPQNAAAAGDRNRRTSYNLDTNGIASFGISGPMSKAVGSMSEGTSTVRVRQAIREAAKDPNVRGAILAMDTPGGTVKGNRDLADEVARFDSQKPIFAFGEDLVASAGVSVASQARRVFVNQASSLYGAMGTYSVITDQSKAADQLGVQVYVIKAGQFKGMGEPGTPVTADQLVELQRMVDDMNESYLQLIQRGRGLSIDQVRSMADGRIHTASVAESMGLIDGIRTIDQVYGELLAEVSSSQTSSRHPANVWQVAATDGEGSGDDGDDTWEERERKQKARRDPDLVATSSSSPEPPEREDEPMAATLQQLRETFPNADSDWVLQQLEAGAEISGAAASYAAHIDEIRATETAAHEQELAAAQQGRRGGLGHQALTPTNVQGGQDYLGDCDDPIEEFNSLVEQQMLRSQADPNDTKLRFQIIRSVANRNPKIYAQYLLACNPGRQQQRQLTEKYEDALAD